MLIINKLYLNWKSWKNQEEINNKREEAYNLIKIDPDLLEVMEELLKVQK